MFIYIYFIRLRMLQYNAIILYDYDDIIKGGKKILKKNHPHSFPHKKLLELEKAALIFFPGKEEFSWCYFEGEKKKSQQKENLTTKSLHKCLFGGFSGHLKENQKRQILKGEPVTSILGSEKFIDVCCLSHSTEDVNTDFVRIPHASGWDFFFKLILTYPCSAATLFLLLNMWHLISI